ncbi:helix-turn-helix domain-containing protein [Faecalimonas sp. LCP19S3_D12]
MNERIKRIRHELGLTQTEFAKRIGLKQNSMALIESGKRNTSAQAILSICREYGVNENWLRTGDGEMFEELTEQQKLMKYTGLLLKDKDSAIATAIQTLIVTYEQLDDTSKATLEKIAMQYIDNLKKSQ